MSTALTVPTPKTDDSILKVVARLPASLVIEDESTAPAATLGSAGASGYLRKQDDEANGSFQPVLCELNGTRLSFHKNRQHEQRVKAHRLSTDHSYYEAPASSGHLDLRSVSLLHPLKLRTERFGFCLTTSECTWMLAADSEEDYLRWLRALCNSTATGMLYNAVHVKYKRMLQLQEVPADAITDVRMLVDISDTVGVAVEWIFSCYTRALDAAPLRAYDPADFVLRVQDAADEWSVDLLDRSQVLRSSQRMRECAAANRALLVEIVRAAPEISTSTE